jgi:hypothetical protein
MKAPAGAITLDERRAARFGIMSPMPLPDPVLPPVITTDPGPSAVSLVAATLAVTAWAGLLPVLWRMDSCTVMSAAIPVAAFGTLGVVRIANGLRFTAIGQLILGICTFFFTMYAAAGEERQWQMGPPRAYVRR